MKIEDIGRVLAGTGAITRRTCWSAPDLPSQTWLAGSDATKGDWDGSGQIVVTSQNVAFWKLKLKEAWHPIYEEVMV